MDLHLAGRRMLVTGASQGIGEGLARAFAEEGCNLILVARDAEKLAAVAARLRAEFKVAVDVLVADLTDGRALDRLIALDGVDVLVNNAGAIPGGDLQTVGPAAWRRAWDLKVEIEQTFAPTVPNWPHAGPHLAPIEGPEGRPQAAGGAALAQAEPAARSRSHPRAGLRLALGEHGPGRGGPAIDGRPQFRTL